MAGGFFLKRPISYKSACNLKKTMKGKKKRKKGGDIDGATFDQKRSTTKELDTAKVHNGI